MLDKFEENMQRDLSESRFLTGFFFLVLLLISLFLLFGVLNRASAATRYEISDGTVLGLYHMENASGTDSSGYGNDLNFLGGSYNGTSSIFNLGYHTCGTAGSGAGNCPNGNGATGAVTASDLAPTGTISISGWFNFYQMPPNGGTAFLFGNSSQNCDCGVTAFYTTSGSTSSITLRHFRQGIFNDDVSITDNPSLNTWHLFILNYDGTTAELYEDNILILSENVSGNGNASPSQAAFAINDQPAAQANLSVWGTADDIVARSKVFSSVDRSGIWNSGVGREVCVDQGCGSGQFSFVQIDFPENGQEYINSPSAWSVSSTFIGYPDFTLFDAVVNYRSLDDASNTLYFDRGNLTTGFSSSSTLIPFENPNELWFVLQNLHQSSTTFEAWVNVFLHGSSTLLAISPTSTFRLVLTTNSNFLSGGSTPTTTLFLPPDLSMPGLVINSTSTPSSQLCSYNDVSWNPASWGGIVKNAVVFTFCAPDFFTNEVNNVMLHIRNIPVLNMFTSLNSVVQSDVSFNGLIQNEVITPQGAQADLLQQYDHLDFNLCVPPDMTSCYVVPVITSSSWKSVANQDVHDTAFKLQDFFFALSPVGLAMVLFY